MSGPINSGPRPQPARPQPARLQPDGRRPGTAAQTVRAAIALAAVIVAGLASRRYPHLLPGLLDKETGDALWATAAFFALRGVRPRWSTAAVAGVSLAVAVCVEFSQAYHQPTLDRFRSHGVGHLILGSGFSWVDQGAYAVGVAIAWPADVWWVRSRVEMRR